MNRDKQIEEMAEIINKNTEFDTMWDEIYASASALYDAGYRKASEVARAIFEEIEDVLNSIGYFDEIDFKALKKKYTEGEG